mgnify:CR=1 FL=1
MNPAETIEFKDMAEEYLGAAAALYNRYVLETTATFHTEPLGARDMRELLFFQSDRFRSFALLDDGAFCGYLVLSPYKRREAYDTTAEVTVYLDAGHTGRGIGTLALRYAETVASDKGFHALLGIICGENSASIKMFEKNGYLRCGLLKEVGVKFGRRLDVVLYEKILGDRA